MRVVTLGSLSAAGGASGRSIEAARDELEQLFDQYNATTGPPTPGGDQIIMWFDELRGRLMHAYETFGGSAAVPEDLHRELLSFADKVHWATGSYLKVRAVRAGAIIGGLLALGGGLLWYYRRR